MAMPTLQVRNLPEHIYRKLVERAKAKRSSIARETVYLLQKSLDMDEHKREQKDILINKMLQSPLPNGDLLPDPVLMIREDRNR